MILLSSNAYNIYWLGRYLARTQYLCGRVPFKNDQEAVEFAHAFCLPAYDACSLNELVFDPEQPYSFSQQFKTAKDNIQELRGLLSAKAYAELNQLIRQASSNASYLCDVVTDCTEIFESEEQDVFLFFMLGQKIEILDTQLRFKQSIQGTLNDLDTIVMMLHSLGWKAVELAWQELKEHPTLIAFYAFNDQLQYMFELS
ncbi:alpha-E domain-containing protein [Acinetobacter sp. UBA1297]|uniref:alpha-E domain-containing protein n=1 Tax=Acinetobacter sp. UBA1297 TaxID=1945925 RepID=UPI002579EEA3|nr:alpha-E domain-containing protein [Acinetobacter sp. UBA1297]